MQVFLLKLDRAVLEGTLLARSVILGYNQNRNFRVILSHRPVNLGDDGRYNPEDQYWKLEDLVLELRSAKRLGDCANWVTPPLSPFEEAIVGFVDFERSVEKGPCIRRSNGCYLKSFEDLPLYQNGAYPAFAEAVDNFVGFAAAAGAI